MQPDMQGMARWLIHHAARRAPELLSSRLEEEWLADLVCRPAVLSRLSFAVGCCWATLMIVWQSARTQSLTPRSVMAVRGFSTPDDGNFGYLSLRSGTVFLITGLHAALFFGLITTLSHPGGFATSTTQEQVLKATAAALSLQ
jgi:hypothetical protein